MTSDGLVKDLISTKCSFLSFLTSSSVFYKLSLASATDNSASLAILEASSAWAVASFSSKLTLKM